jgi:hypothetical protein
MRVFRSRRGANAIEFAMTFPVFIMVLGGMIDCAWLVTQRSAFESAAHLGCREGATRDPGFLLVNLAAVQTYASTQSKTRLLRYGGICNACTVTVDTLYANPAMSLRCKVEGAYKPLFGILPALPLKSQAVVRMEYQR